MKHAFIALAAALAVSACVTINVDDSSPSTSGALGAINNARVRECPAGRRQDNAQTQGFGERHGVEAVDVANTPTADGRMVRLRRVTVAPNGVIEWHDHAQVHGMAMLVSGEMTELRNTCLGAMVYRAGDIAIEDAGTVHSWRNTGDRPAVLLVAHSLAR